MTGRLTDSKELEIAVSVENPNDPWIYNFDNLAFQVQGRRLEFSPKQFSIELLDKSISLSKKILEELPHTPMTACGVNFNFICKEPQGMLLSLFNIADNGAISDRKIRIGTSQISRLLNFDEHSLNLTLALVEGGKVNLNFNYHKAVDSTEKAIQFLATGASKFEQITHELLNNIYQAQVEKI